MSAATRLTMLAGALLALGSSAAAAQENFAPSSPSQLRELGRSLLAETVSEDGRDLNPRWRRDVAMVIDSVRSAAAYEAHPVTWEITSDSSVNAAALPGGVMIVNVGLPLFCEGMGRATGGGVASVAQRKYIGCLAAVIGHEFGHLALGHSDSVGSTIARRQEIRSRRDRAQGIPAAVRDSILMHSLRLERRRELEADEAGALYILRAGWAVQDAIDLFVSMDSVERADGSNSGELTWLRGHPRSTERAALLEGVRARLKLNQRDFDDALSLIAHGVMADSALAMLDRVLKDLPYLPAARHARAVLLANSWLGSASAADLRVRPTMRAYDAQFMTSIKGGDATRLRNARAAFAHALAAMPHPYTLANLAVLDAYAGALPLATQRAELAAQRMPEDADVQNNLGVVHFLAGRMQAARRAFARAEQLQGEDLGAAVAFNVARATLAAGDTAAARPLIARYLRYESSTAWGREAQAMQRAAAGRVGATPTPARTTDTGPASSAGAPATARAPEVAGVRLGTPGSQVLRALGPPESGESGEAGVVWTYESRGLTLLIHPAEGVQVVMLSTPAAGDVAGVRVGDPVPAVLRILGPSTERERHGDAGREVMRFARGSWSILVTAAEGVTKAVAIAVESP